MDDNDRKEVFDRVVATLRQHGLGWIVEQVNEQIHSGKTEFIEVETIKRKETGDLLTDQAGPLMSDVRRGPKAKFPTTVDYNDKEKLELLLDGIIQATSVLDIESSALAQLKAIEPGISSEVRFFSEGANTMATLMSPTRVAGRDRIVRNCLNVISKLREESNED